MKVKFLKPAQRELNEGMVYYELQAVGLGLRFQTEIRQTIERIRKYPEAWQLVGQRTR